MKELTIYALEVLACGGILLGAYAILLERRVRSRWCRAYLLAATLLSAVIPLLRIPVWPGKVVTLMPITDTWTPEVVFEAAPPAPLITPETICTFVYLLGAALIAGLMIWQVVRIHGLRRRATTTRTESFTLIRTPHKIASFSFFRTIYVWDQTPEEEMTAIVAHESSHIAHHHSAERIVMECMKAALWWNPFVWIAARRLTEVEEFEADSDVLQSGYNREIYMNTLFKQLFGYSPDIANGLRNSLTKKRFQMMTKPTTSRYALLRLAATLPALIGLLCAFSFTSRAAVVLSAEGSDQQVREKYTSRLNEKEVSTKTIREHGSPSEQAAQKVQGAKTTPAANTPAQDELKTISVGVILMNKDGKSFSTDNTAPGVIVKQAGGNSGVVTDKQGKATIQAKSGSVLEVSYIGYQPTSILVDDQTEYIVILRSEGKTQEEGAIYTRDTDGVKQTPLYIVDGVEQPTIAELDASAIESLSVLKDKASTAPYGERGRNGVIMITTKFKANTLAQDDDTPFLVVETMPQFQGGDLNAFRQWVQMQLKYPIKALEQNMQGRVVLSFVIEKDGSVSNIQMLQSPDKLLSDEALRVIGSSPAWTPGKQQGKAVRVKYTLPVDFRLTKAENATATTKKE